MHPNTSGPSGKNDKSAETRLAAFLEALKAYPDLRLPSLYEDVVGMLERGTPAEEIMEHVEYRKRVEDKRVACVELLIELADLPKPPWAQRFWRRLMRLMAAAPDWYFDSRTYFRQFPLERRWWWSPRVVENLDLEEDLLDPEEVIGLITADAYLVFLATRSTDEAIRAANSLGGAWSRILDAVKDTPLIGKKIAAQTGHSPKYLRRVLPKLVRSGLLVKVKGRGYKTAPRPDRSE
jgi:hypothetical protein